MIEELESILFDKEAVSLANLILSIFKVSELFNLRFILFDKALFPLMIVCDKFKMLLLSVFILFDKIMVSLFCNNEAVSTMFNLLRAK